MKPITPEQKRKVYVEGAIQSYRNADDRKWVAALWCWKIVGNYERGATVGLASDMGISVDTVEDMAHAYTMFNLLCTAWDGKFRKFVFQARRSPYIYLSHFRALHDAVNKYKLSLDKALDLLMDIVQAEGGIASRAIDDHTRSRYGAETDWSYDAKQLKKKIDKFLKRTDLPKEGRKKASELLEWIGKNA